MNSPLLFLIIFASICSVSSLNLIHHRPQFSSRLSSHGVHNDGKVAVNSPKGNSVSVYNSPVELATALCNDFVISAQNAITRSGRFYVAVPGGSVLKMLGGLKDLGKEVDWSKVHLFYVNHKCVPNDDASATHFKALSIFLDSCPAVAYSMTDAVEGVTKGHDTDAHLYRAQMEAVLPQHDGLPIFDYMLLGMGKDGHIGSLYPGRKEVLMTDSHQWVLSVDKKSPASISLSLPVMNAARLSNSFFRRFLRTNVLLADQPTTATLTSISDYVAPLFLTTLGRFVLSYQVQTRQKLSYLGLPGTSLLLISLCVV